MEKLVDGLLGLNGGFDVSSSSLEHGENSVNV